MRADIAEGLRFLWRHSVLRPLAIMTGVFNLASNAAFAVFVLYAVGLIAVGRTELFLLWVWIPIVVAGVLVGAILDLGYRNKRLRKG